MFQNILSFLILSFVFSHSVIPTVMGAPEPIKNTKKTYALSRFGKPKYPENYTHFNYVNPKAPKRGKFRMATVGTFYTVNPGIVTGIAAEGLGMTGDTLMKKSADDPHTWYGLIAKGAELAPDYSSVTFYLDPRARFHDGTPITTEDIKFSIELLRDKGLPRYKKYYSKIAKMKIIDKQTIQFFFEKDPQTGYDKELPMIIANLRPLSKKSLEGIDFQNTGLHVILGNGPYKVSKVDQGRKIVYERQKDYWAADLPINKGQYNFDEITIEYFKNDQTLREAFKAGEVDTYFETNHRKWETDYDFPAVKKGDVVKVELEHMRPVTVWAPIFNMKNDLFADQRVRKAISMAFDFNHSNKTQFRGYYKRMDSLFANTHFAPKGQPTEPELTLLAPYKNQLAPEIYKSSIQLYPMVTPQDRRKIYEEANQLLIEAGWEIAKSGPHKGFRVHKDSKKPLKFVFLIKDPLLEGMVLSLKESLKRLGVDMEVRKVDTTQYEKNAVDKTFDMILHPWSNSLSPGIEQAYYFDPKTADQPGSSNYIGIKNQALYELAQKLSQASCEEELSTWVKAFDRAVMGMYYMIPGIYENWIRFAYWKTKVAYPPIDPLVSTNAPEWWWSVSTNETPA